MVQHITKIDFLRVIEVGVMLGVRAVEQPHTSHSTLVYSTLLSDSTISIALIFPYIITFTSAANTAVSAAAAA